jgi:hypothetical protein
MWYVLLFTHTYIYILNSNIRLQSSEFKKTFSTPTAVTIASEMAFQVIENERILLKKIRRERISRQQREMNRLREGTKSMKDEEERLNWLRERQMEDDELEWEDLEDEEEGEGLFVGRW